MQYLCGSNYLKTCISEVTRLTATSATTLDQTVISKNLPICNISISTPLGNSDHNQISAEIPLIRVHRPSTYNRLIWQYDKADWEDLNLALSIFNWDLCFTDTDIDNCTFKWTETFINLARTFIPNKIISIRPWITLVYHRTPPSSQKARPLLQKGQEYCHFHCLYIYVKEIKQAKLNYEQRQIDKINNFAPGSSRSWWQTVKVFYKVNVLPFHQFNCPTVMLQTTLSQSYDV